MTRTKARETRIKGLALSEGIAIARVCLFNENRHSNLPVYRISSEEVERELLRFRTAVEVASERLDEVRRRTVETIGDAEAGIFVAQGMIIRDEKLGEEVADHIARLGSNAEVAVSTVMDTYEARILSIDDEYIKERATDFGEVRRRLLDVMRDMSPSLACAQDEQCQMGKNRIVVAEELTPTLTMFLDTQNTMGFVTERGGVNSHAAILARALGIPAISGVKGVRSQISCGTEVMIDGFAGEVIIRPEEATVEQVRAKHKQGLRIPQPVEPVDGLKVMANISVSGDVGAATEMMAEGIGLYRTEFEFISAGRYLTDDEQAERYAEVVNVMNGAPVSFRLFDVGGDKPVPFLHIPKEANPYLGWRGGRLLLGNKDILAGQSRALARVSKLGPINVLYPMIVDLEQFQALREVFDEATQAIDKGEIRHGVMFEVPSACLDVDRIMQVADFGSIGTNDLIQYLFAVDRNNDLVAHDYDPERPVLWSLLEKIAKAAADAGKPLSICGELAGEPKFIRRLLEMGIGSVSVSPRLIPGVRLMLQRIAEESVK